MDYPTAGLNVRVAIRGRFRTWTEEHIQAHTIPLLLGGIPIAMVFILGFFTVYLSFVPGLPTTGGWTLDNWATIVSPHIVDQGSPQYADCWVRRHRCRVVLRHAVRLVPQPDQSARPQRVTNVDSDRPGATWTGEVDGMGAVAQPAHWHSEQVAGRHPAGGQRPPLGRQRLGRGMGHRTYAHRPQPSSSSRALCARWIPISKRPQSSPA